MKKIIYLIFLSLFLVSCDFTTSKNPEDSWIKSVKGKTFIDEDGVYGIFDANGNCSIKITEDTSNDFWAELGKLAIESIQFTYIKAIDKNRAIYKYTILFMTMYTGLKLEKNKLYGAEDFETPDEVSWDKLEYIGSKK
ncbi:hypothetical protein [Brachyspira aalborgi]|uniref:Lipoprotein n=1 Tax=Brachyspira aalborgi TaxID=29522 RepID=A0A5C8G316_9SPIR|nr:hypothetical protein [Brachyspira aalborgi]TXJ56442.1 hypothetical protein EPJ76_04825 [Brachyspira aalborgi]